MNDLARMHLALYDRMAQGVEIEHGQLFSTSKRRSRTEFGRWADYWAYAFGNRVDLGLESEQLVRSGTLLARVAESYSEHKIADQVFRCLELLFEERDQTSLEMAELLASAGELDRRLARLERAAERCQRALAIAERQNTAAAHKLASRVLYELAYIDLYRGEAESALQRLTASGMEAEQAGDKVGAGIARALHAAIRVDEGTSDDLADVFVREAANFAELANSDELRRINRHMFASRWRGNCDVHHVQALLASGRIEAARQSYEKCVGAPVNPSVIGNATLDLTGACLAIAEDRLDDAAALVERSRRAMPLPFENQEAAATIAAIYGVISLERRDIDRARDAFEEAMRMNPSFRNARGQGMAALGLAIIAVEARNGPAALSTLDVGIARCARCCAPIRRALIDLRDEVGSGVNSGSDWRMILRALTGPLPK